MSMTELVVFVATAAALGGGLAYTLRWFKASMAEPAEAPRNGHHSISPHDRATTELLRQFFNGKDCAICKRPIPPVHRTGLKPGLFNPATNEAHSWDEIPSATLETVLESELPLCSACQVAESFRQHHPDLVLDRHRADQHAASH